MKLKDRPINNTSPVTDVAQVPLFPHLSAKYSWQQPGFCNEWSGEIVYGREHVQHKAEVASLTGSAHDDSIMCPFIF